MQEKDNKLKFPKNFLWGSATSAHQVEGGNYNQWTVWELENAKVKSAQAEYQYGDFENWASIEKYAKQPNNYVSGLLTNHYENYAQDFKFLQKMNMNAYRFSIEWSRIEPREGVWSAKEIGHYRDYLDSLKSLDIEPIVTLFHFTLPVWFAEKGGFEKRSNVKYFTRFVKKIVSELGSRFKYVITINEPEVYASASYYFQDWPPAKQSPYKLWRVLNNLAYAHRESAKIIHGISTRYKVSIAKSSAYYYPGDNAFLSQISAKIANYFKENYFINKTIKYCDFLGINYYQSNRYCGSRVHNPDKNLSDLNWDMQPADIQFVLEGLYEKYKVPIIITENGLADAEDKDRKWWIYETIIAMQKAIKNGVKLQGYLHWSLMDNFEWAYGKWPRFGLVEVNYKTGEKKLRKSAEWFGRVIKKIRNI